MDYSRLPGKRNSPNASSRLYLGEDHFMVVETGLFTETYRRFYFSDIQALLIRNTDRGAIWSVVVAFFALLMTACSISQSDVSSVIYGVLAGMALAVVGFNYLKGPTCVTHALTILGSREITPLGRIKEANEALAVIRPLIRQAQGQVSREEILDRTVFPEEEVQTGDPVPDAATAGDAAAPVRDMRRVYTAFFSLLIAANALDLVWAFVPGMTTFMVSGFMTLVTFVSVILVVAIQNRQNAPALARRITGAVLIVYLIGFTAGYMVNVVSMSRDMMTAGIGGEEVDPFSFYTKLVDEGPQGMMLGIVLAVSAFLVVMGTAGLYSALSVPRSVYRGGEDSRA